MALTAGEFVDQRLDAIDARAASRQPVDRTRDQQIALDMPSRPGKELEARLGLREGLFAIVAVEHADAARTLRVLDLAPEVLEGTRWLAPPQDDGGSVDRALERAR